MRPQKMFSLLIPLLLMCSVAFCATDSPKDEILRFAQNDEAPMTKDEAYRAVIGEQLLLLDEYRTVNYDLTVKLQECSGYRSVGMPNADLTLNPSPGGEGLASAQSWRSTSDYYLTQNVQEDIDTVTQAAKDIAQSIPKKGSGFPAWILWASGASVILLGLGTYFKNKYGKKKSG